MSKEIMDFERCQKEFIKKVEVDFDKIESILKMTNLELKNIRNRISYDGYFVKKDYILKNKDEFHHIIKILNELINRDVPKTGQLD